MMNEHESRWFLSTGQFLFKNRKYATNLKNMRLITTIIFTALLGYLQGQDIIPLDTNNWTINAKAYILENYKGKDAIYLQEGSAMLKDVKFKNGTIEFDVFLTERRGFPGVTFRAREGGNAEQFYLRAHLPGKPDANQAISIMNGMAAWQIYFGEAYSFPYDYNYDDWTHVKIVVNEEKAQVFLDYSEQPHLSWIMKHEPQEGAVLFGHGFAPMHYANFKIDESATTLVDFNPIIPDPIEGAIEAWTLSDKFEEQKLKNPDSLSFVIKDRKWNDKVEIDETSVANISRVHSRYGSPGNTVFAKLEITSDRDQFKVLEIGYSDRVVAILNERPIYTGSNRWQSRDYRYLGTVGLFDAVYLDLKEGKNTLLLAVSEDFGGWAIMGRFQDATGLKIK